ncbi:hypothetical protein S1361_21020 [Streptomyces cyanogenus]|uniref:Uncharacterized protein n=1 Tax=Streptomyces cyanogenus TaxID=80860 RepID=A0ABX7TT22_STRCY|nr:hypothetical protein S1361_21020 [Streptomyces cyanogenus]
MNGNGDIGRAQRHQTQYADRTRAVGQERNRTWVNG